MICKILIFLCALSAVMAYPYLEDVEPAVLEPVDVDAVHYVNVPLVRARRQVQLQGGGGGSPGQGFDFGLQGKAPVWQSDNGRHQVDAMGSYSQHLGGPYGNSRPNWGAGVGYTFRF